LAPLVFVRPGELRGAQWDEFDLDAADWRTLGERMKMRAPHIVPLSHQAVAVLRELHALTGRNKLEFQSPNVPRKPISENTLNYALRRMGFTADEMTAHGCPQNARHGVRRALKYTHYFTLKRRTVRKVRSCVRVRTRCPLAGGA